MSQIIIATHIVKPTSPTPLASKIHKLSFLDQISPPIYLPLIFFYENDQSKQQEEISQRLKQSLSEVLAIFYPLAGTITQNSFVDCNDRGAEFVEARVHARLAQFSQNPQMKELKQLFPADSSSHIVKPINLLVKTSYFDCGGVAIAVCFSHKIADTETFVAFTNAWAAICRREASGIFHPSFDLAARFPPRDLSPAFGFSPGMKNEKIVTKRLVFEKEKLRELEASSDDEGKVEAVSAFLWRSFIEANKGCGRTETTSFAASHAVSLRARADNAFGNCFTSASAVVSSEEYDGDEALLVSKMRAAIKAVDDDYINQAIKDDTFRSAGDLFKSGNCYFANWSRFPMYEVDFGLGKPVRVCTETMPYMNLVLMDSPDGDGIEAWINVADDHFFQFLQANYNKLLA